MTTIFQFIEGIYRALGGPAAPECIRFQRLMIADAEKMRDALQKRFHGRPLIAYQDVRIEIIAMMDEMEGKTPTPAAAPTEQLSEADAAEAKRITAVRDELEAVMRKHDLGGVVVLSSMKLGTWVAVIPEWSQLVHTPTGEAGVSDLFFRADGSTPEALERFNATMSLVALIRDACSDYVNVFGKLFRHAKQFVEQQGVTVDSKPFRGGRGIFPQGRKGN